MQYEINYKAGDKIKVLSEDTNEYEDAEILQVSFISYYSANNRDFILEITYRLLKDDAYTWFKITGENNIKTRVKKIVEEAE